MSEIKTIALTRNPELSAFDNSTLLVLCEYGDQRSAFPIEAANYVRVCVGKEGFRYTSSLGNCALDVAKVGNKDQVVLYLKDLDLHIMVVCREWYELLESSDLHMSNRLLLVGVRGWQSEQSFSCGEIAHLVFGCDGQLRVRSFVSDFGYRDVLYLPSKMSSQELKALSSREIWDDDTVRSHRLRHRAVISLRERLSGSLEESVFFKLVFAQFSKKTAVSCVLLRMAFPSIDFVADLPPRDTSKEWRGSWKRLFQNLGVYCEKSASHIQDVRLLKVDDHLKHIPEKMLEPLVKAVNERGYIIPKTLLAISN